MESGKCEDCDKPTDMRDDGQPWKRCLDCGKAAKAKRFEKASEQAKLPIRSAQEEATEIYGVFKVFQGLLQKDFPNLNPECGFKTAATLTQQFWSNARTPGGLNR